MEMDMEYEHGFLDELLNNINAADDSHDFFSPAFNFNEEFEQNPDSMFINRQHPIQQQQQCFFTSNNYNSTTPFPGSDGHLQMVDVDHEHGKVEEKVRGKKGEAGQKPSKNLMAERRRRRRLNDRLSLLRSIVPKISKMDRTSTLGDTIDYMKELLERIHKLRQEIELGSSGLANVNKEVNSNENAIRNSPKLKVERRDSGTEIELCCLGKPGLLLSTFTTLEAFGLEVQQCVISCFNDFALHALCTQDNLKQGSEISCDAIKQALVSNAAYF